MITSSLAARGPDACADYLLCATEVGRLYRLPSVRRAVAQDAVLKTLLPFVQTPDLIEDEEALLQEWEAARREAYAAAKASWEGISSVYAGAGSVPLRRKLRMAACRKLDACVTGKEAFRLHPALGGFPHFVLKLDHPRLTVKIGAVIRSSYGTQPDSPKVPEALSQETVVNAVERALLGFTPPSGSPREAEEWTRAARVWTEVEAMRTFESGMKLPLDTASSESVVIFPEGQTPTGYLDRVDRSELRAIGLDVEQLVRAGISPYIAVPVAEYLERNPALVDAIEPESACRDHLIRRVAKHCALA